MSAEKKNLDMKTYDAHDLRLNELQNKRAGMEECRSVYMTAGSKGAALWSGITAAGAWYSWYKQMWPKYIRPQHLIFLVGAAGTCAFYIEAENRAHECTQRQRDDAVRARGHVANTYSIFGEDEKKH